jgi:hypothetical protein
MEKSVFFKFEYQQLWDRVRGKKSFKKERKPITRFAF